MTRTLAALSLALGLAAAPAAADLSSDIAANGLAATEAALSAAPADDPTRLALAGVRFLRGVERALQTRWTYGIAAERTEVPVMRLPIPPNPAPRPFTAAVVPGLFAALEADMAAARTALTPLPEGDWGVVLRLADLWFDIDGDGARGRGEGLLEVGGAIFRGAGLRGAAFDPRTVSIRFDAADAAWLRAYTHFLSALSALARTWDLEGTISGVMADAAALADLRAGAPPVNALDTLFGAQADRLLILWRLVGQEPDPAATRAVRDHLMAMIGDNRVFWARVDTETDDADEWIPNDRQTSALGLPVPPGTGAGWLGVLDDAEALLTGAKLIPHWRMGSGAGIDLSAMLEAPAPVDPFEWAHGAGFVPWARKGERVGPENWRTFERLVRGDAFLFVLFLN